MTTRDYSDIIKNVKPETTVNRTEIIKMVAAEMGVGAWQVRRFMVAFENVLYTLLTEKVSVKLYGMFGMYVTKVKGHKGWDGLQKKFYYKKPHWRIKMTPSESLQRATQKYNRPEDKYAIYFDDDFDERTIEE